MNPQRRSEWQLPPGVEPGTWEYAHRSTIADDYDSYFADHPLFNLDESFLEESLPAVDPDLRIQVADLGCGTGRALVPLCQRGYEGLAVDLSLLMLAQVTAKATESSSTMRPLCANLVELQGIRDSCVDHVLCLFSTLGMIKGAQQRESVIQHVQRILKPGGTFFLHVHNLWCNALFPGGLSWIASNGWRSLRDKKTDFGDKYYPYRGLSNMYLHVFRRREVISLLTSNGLALKQLTPLNSTISRPLSYPRFGATIRASGWWIVAKKPAD